VLYTFQGNGDGETPLDALVAVNGKLYGTASGGGFGLGDGTIFRVDPSGADFHVLHQFAGGYYDGAKPVAGLVSVKGWLYGTTYQGGTKNGGTVFGLKLSGDGMKILHSFVGGSDGCGPVGTLVYSDGKLYGTTSRCGNSLGTVFSVDSATSEKKTLYTFGGLDGSDPQAGLLMQNGVLYGTTARGGANNEGAVFSLTTDGSESVLHSFGTSDGLFPEAALVAGPDGTMYGTTYEGGSIGWGTLFSITTDGETSVLHNFGFIPDGEFPEAPLLYLGHKVYGTTFSGGRHGHHCFPSQYCDFGTVFKLDV
jgi:uncharacterized repeat protein (TIGR03803 family)